jgi:hypothetical protein
MITTYLKTFYSNSHKNVQVGSGSRSGQMRNYLASRLWTCNSGLRIRGSRSPKEIFTDPQHCYEDCVLQVDIRITAQRQLSQTNSHPFIRPAAGPAWICSMVVTSILPLLSQSGCTPILMARRPQRRLLGSQLPRTHGANS